MTTSPTSKQRNRREREKGASRTEGSAVVGSCRAAEVEDPVAAGEFGANHHLSARAGRHGVGVQRRDDVTGELGGIEPGGHFAGPVTSYSARGKLAPGWLTDIRRRAYERSRQGRNAATDALEAAAPDRTP